MVRVVVALLAPGVTDAGEKFTVAPGGSPVASRATGRVKVPFTDATVTVKRATAPAATGRTDGLMLREKSGVRAAPAVSTGSTGAAVASAAPGTGALLDNPENAIRQTDIAHRHTANTVFMG
jgi:hypothetical protein